MVKVDMTSNDQLYIDELARAERSNIPVNLVYPADYPKRPAILLEEIISPGQALDALDRIAPTEDASATAGQDASEDRVIAGR